MNGADDRRLVGLVLAAGQSRRFPGRNKLLVEVDGAPLLLRTVSVLQKAGLQDIRCISGADHEVMSPLLAAAGAQCIQNSRFAEGMGASLAFGARSIEPEATGGILVCLADLPFLSVESVGKVIQAFRAHACERIAQPIHDGRAGHPLLFPTRCVEELRALSGDVGAKAILRRESANLIRVEVESPGIYLDMDTPDDFLRP